MGTLSDVFETMQTKIAFVSSTNPGTGGGTNVPQTGDVIGIIFAILAAISVMGLLAFFAVKKVQATEYANSSYADKSLFAQFKNTKIIAIGLAIIAAISIAGVCWSYTPFGKAFATADKLSGSELIYAYVDEVTGDIKIDDGFMVNNLEDGSHVYVESTTVDFASESFKDIKGIENATLKIEGLNGIIFEGKIGDTYSWEDHKDTSPLLNGKSEKLTYSISNLPLSAAQALIGQVAFDISFNDAQCYAVTYDVNGATEGEPPAPQVKIPGGTTIIAEPEEGLFRYGYEFDGWKEVPVAKRDAGIYQPGDEYTIDENLKLVVNWKENDVTINYASEDTSIGKVSSESETIKADTGTASGSEASVNAGVEGYKFLNWTDEDGNVVATTAQFTPSKDKTTNIYMQHTYTAHFEKTKLNITFTATEGGKITPDTSAVVEYGTKVTFNEFEDTIILGTGADAKTFTAEATDAAHSFISWSVDPAGQTSVLTKDTTFKACFSADTYVVHFQKDPEAGGSVSQTSLTVPANTEYSISGDTITFQTSPTESTVKATADTSAGYYFTGWTSDVDNGSITKETTFTAHFTNETFKVDFAPGSTAHGTLSDTSINVPAGTSFKVLDNGNIVFGDEASPLHTLVVTNEKYYKVEKWQWFNPETEKMEDTTGGWITASTKMLCYWTDDLITVTYRVYDVNYPFGYIESTYGNGESGPEITEEILLKDFEKSGAEGAVAENYTGEGSQKYISEFINWTLEDNATEVCVNQMFDPTNYLKTNWKDVTFVAHFKSPKAIYNDKTGTMTFYCDEIGHDDVWNEEFKFPVNNNAHCPEMHMPGDEVSYPSWIFDDGTPKVYPVIINFDKSFKQWTNLTSTSFWFSNPYAQYLRPSHDVAQLSSVFDSVADGLVSEMPLQTSSIREINGLENVYADNIKEAAYMFAGLSGQSIKGQALDKLTQRDLARILARGDYAMYLQYLLRANSYQAGLGVASLDLSTWNTPNLEDARGMFEFNYYMLDIKFPPAATSVDSPAFGANIKYADYMFMGDYNLTSININDGFGANITSADRMFYECYSLQEINISSSNFGASIWDAESMFSGCRSLTQINIASKSFCQNVEYADYMFYNCWSIRKIDLTSINNHWQDSSWSNMFTNCFAVTEVWISPLWFDYEPVNLVEYGLGKQNLYSTSGLTPTPGDQRPLETVAYESWSLYIQDMFNIDLTRGNYCPLINPEEESTMWDLIAELKKQGTITGCPIVITRNAPKAILNESKGTFTFYYDSKIHEGKEFGIKTFTGLDSLNNMIPSGMSSAEFRRYLETSGYMEYYYYQIMLAGLTNGIIFPEWYKTFYNSDGSFAYECLIKQPVSVSFDASFYDVNNKWLKDKILPGDSESNMKEVVDIPTSLKLYNYVYSMSLWFVGDSYGKQPYKSFSGFENIPSDVRNFSFMFGGIPRSFANYGYNDGSYYLSDKEVLKPVARYKQSYVEETFGDSIEYLDLSNFHALSDESLWTEDNATSGQTVRLVEKNVSGLLANCTGLKTVKLPQRWYLYNASGLFYNCTSLTSIENINTMDTSDIRYFDSMFSGCSSLTSLDLTAWDTRYVDNEWNYNKEDKEALSLDERRNTSCINMFLGCDMLTSLKIGNNWTLPFETCSLPDTKFDSDGKVLNPWVYNDEEVDVEGTPEIIFNADDEYFYTTMPGEYTRKASRIKVNTFTVVSEDPESGSVSPAGKTFKFVSPLNYYISEFGLTVGTHRFTAKALGENNFKFWSAVDSTGERRIYSQDYYSSQVAYIRSYDLGYISETTTFKANFEDSSLKAKAVYKTNYDESGNQYYSMEFYYDSDTHLNDEGVINVFDVPEYTYFNTVDDYKLPPWYNLDIYSGYHRESDINQGRAIDEPGEWIMKASNAELKEGQTFRSLYDLYFTATTLVKPRDVIFDSSFKNFDNLQSMSLWFVADSYGNQSYKNFYSRVNGQLVPGFENVNTTSLIDMNFVFGGFALEPIIGPVELREYKSERSVFETAVDTLFAETALEEVEEYASQYSTYGTSITNLDLSTLNLKNVPNWAYMLANCVALQQVKFADDIDQAKPFTLAGLFFNCESLGVVTGQEPIVNMDKFDTSYCRAFQYMFYGCSHLTKLDLSNFKTDLSGLRSLVSSRTGMPVPAFSANTYAMYMFTDCLRLNDITINSYFPDDVEHVLPNLRGWTFNFDLSGMPQGASDWTQVKTGNQYGNSEIPFMYLTNESSNDINIVSGQFTRTGAEERKVNFSVDQGEFEEVPGTLNGQEHFDYNFINSATIKIDENESAVVWIDNNRVEALANDGYRFKYWAFANDFGEHKAGDILAGDFNETYLRTDVTSTKYPKFVAVFESDVTTAKAVLYNSNGSASMVFYYNNESYEAGVDDVVAVYPVYNDTTDYRLPAWYKVKYQSWYEGDEHSIPAFQDEIEKNAANGIAVSFDSSFKNNIEITSLSCWFMPAISNVSQTSLCDPFKTSEGALNVSGWENVNTQRVTNVSYMFGGHEYFNEYTGSHYKSIDISGLDLSNVKKLDGLFANCVDLVDITMDDSNSTANATSMRNLFYNCKALMYTSAGATNFTKILSKIDTTNVTDMSYIFANYELRAYNPDVSTEASKIVDSITITLPINFFKPVSNPEDGYSYNVVTRMDGMFAGHKNVKNINVSGSVAGYFTTPNVKSMSSFLRDCTNLVSYNFGNQIKENPVDSLFKTDLVRDMSYFFYGCEQFNNYNFIINNTLCASSASDMSYMFYGCKKLTTFNGLNRYTYTDWTDGQRYNPCEITNCAYMFANCDSLIAIDLSNMYIQSEIYNLVPAYYNMFAPGNSSIYNDTIKYIVIHPSNNYISWNFNVSLHDLGIADYDSTTGNPLYWIIASSSYQQEDSYNYLVSELSGARSSETGYKLNSYGHFVRAENYVHFASENTSMGTVYVNDEYDYVDLLGNVGFNLNSGSFEGFYGKDFLYSDWIVKYTCTTYYIELTYANNKIGTQYTQRVYSSPIKGYSPDKWYLNGEELTPDESASIPLTGDPGDVFNFVATYKLGPR